MFQGVWTARLVVDYGASRQEILNAAMDLVPLFWNAVKTAPLARGLAMRRSGMLMRSKYLAMNSRQFAWIAFADLSFVLLILLLMAAR